MLRRKRSAEIVKTVPRIPKLLCHSLHSERSTRQMLVLVSECSLANEVKSSVSIRTFAASFMAATSSPDGESHDIEARNGDFPNATKYLYVRLVASNRAWASSSTGMMSAMEIAGPQRRFSDIIIRLRSPISSVVSKCAYITRALTPVSVRPAPVTGTGRRNTVASASSRVCCTLTAFGCDCHPWNGAPS